jgi:FtsP/CotA-like multicopper oxidase with cupredoxin domain
LQSRPSETPDSIVIKPGTSKTVAFDAGEPGTYFYWIKLGNKISSLRTGEEDQLSGAFVIDPRGGSPPDRIFVMNIFNTRIDTALYAPGHLEALTINGKSWPYTERQQPSVGDTLRWRIINPSSRNHPMHLHGFYYDVTSIGTMLNDDYYSMENRRKVVTEFMLRRTTMTMEWIASRPGNWLFHCHLSFHVGPNLRLPGISEIEKELSHMAGLVLGIQIPDGPSDLISIGDPKYLTLQVDEYDTIPNYKYQFSLISDSEKDPKRSSRPGPLLILKQYQDTYITLENNMSMSTGIHWHGLELDSWADGVPDWSSSEGLTSPIVRSGEKFTYKLSLMRAGSFIYHTHLDDVNQLAGGLYGPIIVLGENETYDPAKDHFYIVSWKNRNPKSFEDLELNGTFEQPLQQAHVGETHRIRLMHIAPAGNIVVRMLKDDQPVPIKYIAKDGADLPEHQQINIEVSPRYGVGETADFAFTPIKPGMYELQIGSFNNPKRRWKQAWEVKPGKILAKL